MKKVKEELRYMLQQSRYVVGIGVGSSSPSRYAIIYTDNPYLTVQRFNIDNATAVASKILRDAPERVEDMPVVIKNVGRITFLPLTREATRDPYSHSHSHSHVAVAPTTSTAAPTTAITLDPRNPLSLLASLGRGLLAARQFSVTQSRVRPLLAGVSISPVGSSSSSSTRPIPNIAGTLGAFFKDKASGGGRTVLITNNHVIANDYRYPTSSSSSSSSSPLSGAGAAAVAAPTAPPTTSTTAIAVMQPSILDGGNIQTDRIASLYKWIPLWLGSDDASTTLEQQQTITNKVDVAIAILDDDSLAMNPYQLAIPVTTAADGVSYAIYSTEYYDDLLARGDILHKVGRSSGYTSAPITDTSAMLKVYVDENRYALFDDVVVTDAMATAGDSGSMGFTVRKVLKEGGGGELLQLYPAALLFAGSPVITVFCKMQNIIEALQQKGEGGGGGSASASPSTTAAVDLGLKPLSSSSNITISQGGASEGGGVGWGSFTPPLQTVENIIPPLAVLGFLGLSTIAGFMMTMRMSIPPPSPSSSPPPPPPSSSSSSSLSSPQIITLSLTGRGREGGGGRGNKEKEEGGSGGGKRGCRLCDMLRQVKEELEMEEKK